MANPGSGNYDRLDFLAEEFAARYRRGERPSLKEYIDRNPELADDIRELFPALAEIEQAEEDRRLPPPSGAGTGLPLRQVGDYRLLCEVGRGGMGVVYEAEQIGGPSPRSILATFMRPETWKPATCVPWRNRRPARGFTTATWPV
jgi:hypothetical protein